MGLLGRTHLPSQMGRVESLEPRQEDSSKCLSSPSWTQKAAHLPCGSQKGWPLPSVLPTGIGAIPVLHAPVLLMRETQRGRSVVGLPHHQPVCSSGLVQRGKEGDRSS